MSYLVVRLTITAPSVIDKLDKLFKAAVKAEVEKRLAGANAPKGNGSKPAEITKESAKKMSMAELNSLGNGDTIPTVTTMVAILHASLQQYHHGISLADAYGVFDSWIEDGNTSVDFVPVILEIYKASGIIPKEADTEKN